MVKLEFQKVRWISTKSVKKSDEDVEMNAFGKLHCEISNGPMKLILWSTDTQERILTSEVFTAHHSLTEADKENVVFYRPSDHDRLILTFENEKQQIRFQNSVPGGYNKLETSPRRDLVRTSSNARPYSRPVKNPDDAVSVQALSESLDELKLSSSSPLPNPSIVVSPSPANMGSRTASSAPPPPPPPPPPPNNAPQKKASPPPAPPVPSNLLGDCPPSLSPKPQISTSPTMDNNQGTAQNSLPVSNPHILSGGGEQPVSSSQVKMPNDPPPQHVKPKLDFKDELIMKAKLKQKEREKAISNSSSPIPTPKPSPTSSVNQPREIHAVLQDAIGERRLGNGRFDQIVNGSESENDGEWDVVQK